MHNDSHGRMALERNAFSERSLLSRMSTFGFRICICSLLVLTAQFCPASVVITEFMAENDGFLQDSDGESSDWLELHNTGSSIVNLSGWHLTDTATNLTRWTLPSTNIAPGGYVVVFASGKNRTVPGAELHTNFRLQNEGGYLALVRPDLTVAHSYGPAYPVQRSNRSFGIGREVIASTLIASGTSARWRVPVDGSLALNWTSSGFDDSAWNVSSVGLGYDTNATAQGQAVLAIDINERGNNPGTTAPGFSSFIITSNTSVTTVQVQPTVRTFSGISVSIGNPSLQGYDDRLRAAPTNFAAFTNSLLLRDFVFARSIVATGGLDIALSGLEPDQGYSVSIWSYDASSPGSRVSDWYANGLLARENYTFDGSIAPTTNTDYQFSFDTASDAAGKLLIAARHDPASANASGASDFGVFLNAFKLTRLSLASHMASSTESAMHNQNASVYIRIPFQVSDPGAIDLIRLRMKYDDGFIAYLNGQRIAGANAPAFPAWNSTATAAHGFASASRYEDFTMTNQPGLLVAGDNILAIHGLNVTAADSDFLIVPELELIKIEDHADRYFAEPSVGADNEAGYFGFVAETSLSVSRGFYDSPFSLQLSCSTPGSEIRYTLDGATPSPTNGIIYTSPLAISGQSIVRAASFKAGLIPSDVETHTYIFLQDVLAQPNQLPNYPTNWQANYPADYEMDPNIVNHPVYGPTLPNDLRSLPTLSIVTDHDSMWGANNGIYNHPTSIGDLWDRAASVELIDEDGSTEFATTCGISMHGNASRDNVRTPKHSFRLKFQSRWGASKLRYNWFGGSVEEFDNIVLRAAGFVDGWPSRYSDNTLYTNALTGEVYRGQRYRPETSTYLRDVWVKQSHRDMGWLTARSRWVHVYVNGLYWGMYNPSERIDASFISEHSRGTELDWDVLVGDDAVFNAAVADGTKDDWNAMLAIVNAGITNQAAYNAVANLVDLDSLIDYMLLHIFAEVEDWPHHNWYAVHRRANATNGTPATKWQFLTWDQEVSLDRNVRRNRVDVGATGNQVDSPARIYSQLRAWPEFNVRFGDRAHKHLFNSGALTPSNNITRFATLANVITNAIVAESARWGDAREFPNPGNTLGTGQTFTRDEWWVPELHKLWTNFFVTLNDTNVARLRAGGLYPALGAPSFNQFGGNVPNGFSLTIAHTNTSGVVYFTTDGTDPRAEGGAISAGAQAYSSSLPIHTPTQVRARVRNGSAWSALVDATFYPPQDLGALALTELMYHPPASGPNESDAFEFLELKNTGTNTLDLSGLRFTQGITFTFTNGTMLAPSGFCVLVRDAAAFASRYPGVPVRGIFSGRLDNAGETLALTHAVGQPVLSITYDDLAPWPATADGFGFSIVPVATGAAQASDNGAKWRASSQPLGSPGADDPASTIPRIVINELLTHTQAPAVDRIELFNPTASPVDIGGWFVTDLPATPAKYRIPSGTVIPAGGYIVFDESHFNPTPGTNGSFSLSSQGEQVYLFSADLNSNLTGYSHGLSFSAAALGVSFGRYLNSIGEEQFPAQITPTFGSANVGPRVGPLVVNEIQYHPTDGMDPFIELKNISGAELALIDPLYPTNGWRIEGVDFTFSENASVPANGFVLIVATNPAAFRQKYGISPAVPIFGPYPGTLQQSGERITVTRPDAPDTTGVPYITVDSVRYNDRNPWPPAADGAGPSLQRNISTAYGDDPANWYAAESTPGTENTLPDTDADGLPDWWETAFGSNPLVPDATADPDNDGFTNHQEYLAGTEPRDPASLLRVARLRVNGGSALIEFNAASNRSYSVQYKASLTDPGWLALTNLPAVPAAMSVTVHDTPGTNSMRLYRLVTP